MIIIKCGNQVKSNRTFICQDCRCEFIATKAEYSHSITEQNQEFKDTYEALCPGCGEIVTVLEEQKKAWG